MAGKAQHKFNVGDEVKGITDRYAYTNTNMTRAKVTKIDLDGDITVEIMEHVDPSQVGKSYPWVNPEDFELVEPKSKFKAGDKVTVDFNDKVYTLVKRRLSADSVGFGLAWTTDTEGWIGENQITGLHEPKPKISVGDTVKVVATGFHFLEVGGSAEITKVYENTPGRDRRYQAEGKRRGEHRIVSQTVKESDLEPIVEDKPKRIKMLKDDWVGDYDKGDVFEVVTTHDGNEGFIDNVGDERLLGDHPHEVVGEEMTEETKQPERPKVGDKVRVIARHDDRSPTRHQFPIGAIVEVNGDDGEDTIPLECGANGVTWYLDIDEVEPATDITRSDVVSFLLTKDDTEILDIITEARQSAVIDGKELWL
jgi:hypothetical protein